MIAEWFNAADPWRTGMEHTAWLIGVVTFVVATVKGIRGWRKARDEAIAARTLHEAMLTQVIAQFRPNGGSSVVDKLNTIDDKVTDHVTSAQAWFTANDEAHAVIHRRIDGVFELLAGSGSTAPRKTAARHQNRDSEETP